MCDSNFSPDRFNRVLSAELVSFAETEPLIQPWSLVSAFNFVCRDPSVFILCIGDTLVYLRLSRTSTEGGRFCFVRAKLRNSADVG